jgi:hypothetical protein
MRHTKDVTGSGDFVDFGEAIAYDLRHPTFLLCLRVQIIQVLKQQIGDVIGRLEMQRQHTAGSKDAEQHLHAMADLLDSLEPSTHALLHPSRY